MDHRELLDTLNADQRRSLTAKSDRVGLLHLAGHLACIGVTSALIVAQVPFWYLFMLPQGFMLIFLFTLMHETMHRTPFESRWLNDGVAWLCGVLLVLPPTWFRHFHFAHHRHTQDPQKDPELSSPKPNTRWQYALHVSGIPVWKSQISSVFTNAFGAFEYDYLPKSAVPKVKREARLMLAIYALFLALGLLSQNMLLVYLWVIPLVLGQPFLRLYLLAEHGRCAFVANVLENTRTTFTNRLVRFFAWNMPYHAEHHAFPAVPFHKLPEFHNITKQHLKITEQGYSRFNRSYVAKLDEQL